LRKKRQKKRKNDHYSLFTRAENGVTLTRYESGESPWKRRKCQDAKGEEIAVNTPVERPRPPRATKNWSDGRKIKRERWQGARNEEKAVFPRHPRSKRQGRKLIVFFWFCFLGHVDGGKGIMLQVGKVGGPAQRSKRLSYTSHDKPERGNKEKARHHALKDS